MEEARVRLGSLNAAWQDFETEWPKRSDAGVAECDLIADCPSCHRPSMVALGERDVWDNGRPRPRRYVCLVPVRTETDAAYVWGRP